MENENGALVKHEVCEVPTILPADRIKFAQGAAKDLMKIVKEQKLSRNFGGKKDHLYYEAWNTIAEFYGYALGAEDSQPIGEASEKGQYMGFTAKGYVRRKSDGMILATAESSCMRDEANWKNKANYQLRSMAQTRAASKAARMLLSWVVVLAGYHPTPAEEMDGVREVAAEVVDEPEEETIIKAEFAVKNRIKEKGWDAKIEDFSPYICGQGTYRSGPNKGKPFNRYKIPVSVWEKGLPPDPEVEHLEDIEEIPFELKQAGEAGEGTGADYLSADEVKDLEGLASKSGTELHYWLNANYGIAEGEPIPRHLHEKITGRLGNLRGA